ncbi:MAG: RNA polymerase, sigma 70 subunit, RpoD subfamily [Parcubacteria group bacterium Gr01-1014_20]|nr:MAG: RNA polymerase, sigma 70 subunit, RpoD subfamily [Parcubacteria group bacterium Gr01-1014_20]
MAKNKPTFALGRAGYIPKRREGKTSNMNGRPKRGREEGEALDLYLNEIGRIPLLTGEQERALATRVREGDEEACQKLVQSNLRFVVSVAKQYQNQGMTLGDLINEGNVGLMKAAKRFDPSLGFKFISYAVWWIRQAVLQALSEQSRIVRLPLNKVGDLQKINRTKEMLEKDGGQPADAATIADELGMSSEDVTRALQIAGTHLSLDAPFAGAEDTSLMDILEDEAVVSPDVAALEGSLRDAIDVCLSQLSAREELVVRLYSGLSADGMKLTLEEIGVRLNITRERVRQIKEKALKRLRIGNRARLLRSFYDSF